MLPFIFGFQELTAQCSAGQVEVTIKVETDNWGYEAYWELLPNGNSCGSGALFSGGNAAQVGCNGGGNQSASSGGYGNNSSTTEGPWCLTDGSTYDIRSVDNWGDGGTEFTVYIDGFPLYNFKANSSAQTFTFLAQGPLAENVRMDEISNFGYVNTGSVGIEGHLFNFGANVITSLDLYYSINGGTPVMQALTGLNIAPFTEYPFVHATPWNASTNGSYDLKVWSANPNGTADLDMSNDTLSKTIEVGPPVPNIIDLYLTNIAVYQTIGTSSDQLSAPRDLDFHPTLTNKELWVVNKDNEGSGGSTVTFSDAGESNQSSQWRRDGNAWHFMSLPTAIAFGENENFATSPGVFDANHNGGNPFTGPSLWSSDPAVYAQPSGGNGSHLDMLHESPYAMGIAHEEGNAYWVFDGHNQDIVRYDFADDHGPGNDFHADAIVWRVTGFSVKRINDHIASHLVLDKESGWLYIIDGGNKRVLRMDINTGSLFGSPSAPQYENLAQYTNLNGVTWEILVDTGLVEPSGIEVIGDRMLVSDHSTGDIRIYDLGVTGFPLMGKIETGVAGIMGLKIGPEGFIWYVNASTNQVVKIEQGAIAIDDEIPAPVFVAYPNPATDQLFLHIDSKGNPNLKLELTNLQGKTLKTIQNMSNGKYSFDISQLSAGMYFLSLQLGGESVQTQKIIIRK